MRMLNLIDRAVSRVIPKQTAGACIPNMGDCCQTTRGGNAVGSLTCTGGCDLSHHC